MKIEEPNLLKSFAHIVDGKVVNVSLWDEQSEWNPDETVVEIPEGVAAGIDWDYVDGQFADNRPKFEDELEV